MYHQIILIIHLLAATIWVGGHLILLLRYVPKALKDKTLDDIAFFRKNFEPVGIPALLILLITGILLAYDYGISFDKWFNFQNSIEKIVSLKIALFFCTILLAFTAVKFIFPSLQNKPSYLLYLFISLVTMIAVTMLILGSLVRIGGI
ncbi:copper resistance protein CopD [Flavobacterium sp. HXWNR29]|jgi:putative copper export protein|uniref:copper resistance protein CopD n=1 Tax=Flavobacterium odoriferum TaxID=2946604 RepID=UPI0021CAF0A0|nr:copper resistance protein CopD [Flavobacterium sp. HXWNR29]MCU4188857.1 copper resistance protein CopD [Flavobacterium sp. HXWNR29]